MTMTTTTTPIKLKEQNYWMILDFAMGRHRRELCGIKLQALFTLIEKKGAPIETNDERVKGLKALQISDVEFIAIKREAINGSFYPCELKTYLLTALKK